MRDRFGQRLLSEPVREVRWVAYLPPASLRRPQSQRGALAGRAQFAEHVRCALERKQNSTWQIGQMRNSGGLRLGVLAVRVIGG